MPEITAHKPGTFCWTDLSTPDPQASKGFYTRIFNWEPNDMPLGEGMVYSMMQVSGKEAAAISPQMEEQKAQGMPPYWSVYVAVESADETCRKATAAGGKVVMEPMDVFDQGRLAMIQDPTGAVLGLWEPLTMNGARVLGEPGAITWNELSTDDMESAKKFYGTVFGWESETQDTQGGPYVVFSMAGEQLAGMMQKTEQMADVPNNWMIYFNVASCDTTVQQAAAAGGRIIVPAMDIPDVGRFAVIQDPQGAVFSILETPEAAQLAS